MLFSHAGSSTLAGVMLCFVAVAGTVQGALNRQVIKDRFVEYKDKSVSVCRRMTGATQRTAKQCCTRCKNVITNAAEVTRSKVASLELGDKATRVNNKVKRAATRVKAAATSKRGKQVTVASAATVAAGLLSYFGYSHRDAIIENSLKAKEKLVAVVAVLGGYFGLTKAEQAEVTRTLELAAPDEEEATVALGTVVQEVVESLSRETQETLHEAVESTQKGLHAAQKGANAAGMWTLERVKEGFEAQKQETDAERFARELYEVLD